MDEATPFFDSTDTEPITADSAADLASLASDAADGADTADGGMAALWRWLALAGGLGGGLSALEYLRSRFQHQSVFLPDRYPNGVWDPQPFGLTIDDVWFSSADGTALHGWWIGHREAAATLVYCHGNSGSIGHRIGIYRWLHQRLGVNVFAFDYRGYGRSAGTPTEAGVYADAQAAVDYLTGEIGETPERMVLFGHSLGGAVAIETARHRPTAGLVVQSSFTDIKEMARILHPQVPLHWLARNAFRSIDKVGGLELPKLFIHGSGDSTVPFPMGRRLFEAAAAPKDFLEVPRAGHNDLHLFGGAGYHERLGRFLAEVRGRAVAPLPASSDPIDPGA